MDSGFLTDKQFDAKLRAFSWDEYQKAISELKIEVGHVEYYEMTPENRNWCLIATMEDNRKKEKAKQKAKEQASTPMLKGTRKHKPQYSSDSEASEASSRSSRSDKPAKKVPKHHHYW